MNSLLVNIVRRPFFQPLWKALNHLSLVAMNYYGGASLMDSGELDVLRYVGGTIINEPDAIVFDVGANDGRYLNQALKILPGNTTYYCFEPSTKAFKLLEALAQGKSNVLLQKYGIGEIADKLVLKYPVVGSVFASLHAFNSNAATQSEEIDIITIDAFCAERNIERIHFLKMDIEGHELAALKGARKMIAAGKILKIQFEFGETNIASRTYLKDFYDELAGQYNIYRIVRGGFIEMGKYSEENEVFLTTNYLAILKP